LSTGAGGSEFCAPGDVSFSGLLAASDAQADPIASKAVNANACLNMEQSPWV
jgi:hypothetical protein